jgi:hypothetical protein
MNKQNQNGSVHIVITGVITLIIIGAVGFFYWSNFLQPRNEKTIVKSTPVTSTGVSPKEKIETLTLSDWGVEFDVPSNLKKADIYYYRTHVAEAPDYYGFTTDRVRAQGGLCDNEVSGNLAKLDRSSIKSNTSTLVNETPIGSYYYYLTSTIGDIDPAPDCLMTEFAVSDHKLLDEMIKTIKKVEFDKKPVY